MPANQKRGRRQANGHEERIPRGIGNQVHRFRRRWDYGVIGKAAVDAGYATSFALSDLPNYTEFTNLFDRWRIREVTLEFCYQQAINTATFCFPFVILSTDLNDAVTPLTENQLLERENAKMHNFSAGRTVVRHVLQPRQLAAGSGGSLTTEMPRDSWVDCAYSSSPYYGFKAWIGNYNSAISGAAQLRLYLTYDLEFKTAR
jgi:hypothetical protein